METRNRQKSHEAHQEPWPLRLVKYRILNLRSRWQAMSREMVKLTASPSELRNVERGREHAHLHSCKRQEVLEKVDPNHVHDYWSHRRTGQEPLERTPQAELGKS